MISNGSKSNFVRFKAGVHGLFTRKNSVDSCFSCVMTKMRDKKEHFQPTISTLKSKLTK